MLLLVVLCAGDASDTLRMTAVTAVLLLACCPRSSFHISVLFSVKKRYFAMLSKIVVGKVNFDFNVMWFVFVVGIVGPST